MFIPVSTQHFETSYLRCGAYVPSDAGTDVVVTNTYQSDGFAGIVGQSAQFNAVRQFVASDILERHGQVGLYQFVHASLYLFLLLSAGLLVQVETHLALFPFHMSIIAAPTVEHPDHGLIEQMFGCVSRRKLLLVMFVQYVFVHVLFTFLPFYFPRYRCPSSGSPRDDPAGRNTGRPEARTARWW